jgi:uncharacterized DUF497 family protein
MSLQYEWDPNKAIANEHKHGVTFEDAATVFVDPLAAIFDDEDHSTDEVREIIIGHSATHVLLLVSFTECNGVIRIISARRTTKRERRAYETNRSF